MCHAAGCHAKASSPALPPPCEVPWPGSALPAILTRCCVPHDGYRQLIREFWGCLDLIKDDTGCIQKPVSHALAQHDYQHMMMMVAAVVVFVCCTVPLPVSHGRGRNM